MVINFHNNYLVAGNSNSLWLTNKKETHCKEDRYMVLYTMENLDHQASTIGSGTGGDVFA